MNFQNIDFHNVVEIDSYQDGYRLWRIPKKVRKSMSERTQKLVAHYTTGVELRFILIDEEVSVYLKAESTIEAQVAYIFFGSFQGGWNVSTKLIGKTMTKITIKRPENLNAIKQIEKSEKLGFSSEMVRIVLPYGSTIFGGIEGKVKLPIKTDSPSKVMLSYGSSITHGSLCLASPYAYPFRLSQKLNIDYLNLGLAGAAFLEPEIAKYIVNLNNWSFATLELGINMLTNYSENEFERKVIKFFNCFDNENRPVVVTNMVQVNKNYEKADHFRQIIQKHIPSKNNFFFIDGLELLNTPSYISGDLVHPTLEGMNEITNHFFDFIQNNNIDK